jgi:hypothetical protein
LAETTTTSLSKLLGELLVRVTAVDDAIATH